MPHASQRSSGDASEVPRQMTPTATWWFRSGTDRIATLSLAAKVAQTKPPSQWPTWGTHTEHWFTTSGSLTSALNVSTLELRCQNHSSSGPTPGLEQDALLLVSTWSPRFKSKTVLYDPQSGVDHWSAGVPTWSPNSSGFYFESTSVSPQPRVYFQLDAGGALQSIVWLTNTRYGSLTVPQSPITLTQVAHNGSWPSASYYYKAP